MSGGQRGLGGGVQRKRSLLGNGEGHSWTIARGPRRSEGGLELETEVIVTAPQTPSLVRTAPSCAVCSLGLVGPPHPARQQPGACCIASVSLGRRRLLDPMWQRWAEEGRGGGRDPIPNQVSSRAFFVLKLSKSVSLAELNPRVRVEQLLYFRNQLNRRNDEQTSLSRPFLVLSRLFCSRGSGSEFSLQSPWSPPVSEAGTALLLREPGRLLSLLGLARVLGLGGKTAALRVPEGDSWELSRASATHRVLPGSAPGKQFAGGTLDPGRGGTVFLSLRGYAVGTPRVTVRTHRLSLGDVILCRMWLVRGMGADLGCGYDSWQCRPLPCAQD